MQQHNLRRQIDLLTSIGTRFHMIDYLADAIRTSNDFLHHYELTSLNRLRFRELSSALHDQWMKTTTSRPHEPSDFLSIVTEVIQHRADTLDDERILFDLAERLPEVSVHQNLTRAEQFTELALRSGLKTYSDPELISIDSSIYAPKTFSFSWTVPELNPIMDWPMNTIAVGEIPFYPIEYMAYTMASNENHVMLMISVDKTNFHAEIQQKEWAMRDDFALRWSLSCPGCDNVCRMQIHFREIRSLYKLLYEDANCVFSTETTNHSDYNRNVWSYVERCGCLWNGPNSTLTNVPACDKSSTA